MSRRIDVELTSARDDGTFTWRAAGAKQPKGVLAASLLYPGAAVGDVLRVEADFEVDGITIVAVLPPKTKRAEPEGRLEIVGSGRDRDVPGVTSSLVEKSERPRRDRRDRPFGESERRGDRPDRGERRDRRPAAATEGGGAGTERPSRPPRERGPARRPERPAGERAERGDRPAGDRPPRSDVSRRPAPPEKPKPKRLAAGSVHRDAALAALAPEQRPIAEQVLRGGIPALRQAVAAQNASRAEGTPEVRAEPLIAMAEEVLPALKEAEWRDRAEAAAAAVDEISLRDLRSVVTSSDGAARGEDARTLATTLREALERRLATQREEWIQEVTTCLDDGRLVRSLRVSARPPDPATRLPADLAVRLAEAASAAMNAEAQGDRWLMVLDAVLASPVRRTVKPAGLPTSADETLLQAARQASGRIPALAALLGIDMPPPPGPARPGSGRPRPPRPPSGPGRPPPPPRARQLGGPLPAPEEGMTTEPVASEAAPPPAESVVAPAPEEGPAVEDASGDNGNREAVEEPTSS